MYTTTQIGLEPTTFAVTGRRSNQLSHWAVYKYCTLKTEHCHQNPAKLFFSFLVKLLSD